MKEYIENFLKNYLSHREPSSNPSQRKILLESGQLSLKENGIFIFTPHEKEISSPLILSCGIHGNETAPIEILNDILQNIVARKLIPKRPLLFIFAHQKSIIEHKRFIDYNLNRLFNGEHKNHQDSMEAAIAEKLEKLLKDFTKIWGKGIHLDLHTAIRPSQIQKFSIAPLDHNSVLSQENKNLLESLGVEAVVPTYSEGTTFSSFSKKSLHWNSYTLELGKVRPFGENKQEDFRNTYDGLWRLISDTPLLASKNIVEYKVDKELINDSRSYFLNIPSDYVNFTPLEEGSLIEKNRDGNLLATKNQCIIFPNSNVPIGQRSGLLLSLASSKE